MLSQLLNSLTLIQHCELGLKGEEGGKSCAAFSVSASATNSSSTI